MPLKPLQRHFRWLMIRRRIQEAIADAKGLPSEDDKLRSLLAGLELYIEQKAPPHPGRVDSPRRNKEPSYEFPI